MNVRSIPLHAVPLDKTTLDRLMPMHLALSNDGQIVSCGPTLRKLDPIRAWIGEQFLDAFDLRRPSGVQTFADFQRCAGHRMHLSMRNGAATGLRGVALPMADGQGLILNLSFGVTILDAVRHHKLTECDFAVTDLAMELLYLVEVKTALMDDLRQLNLLLHGAKAMAEEEAQTDTLTGLGNRRALNQAMATLTRAQVPFALMHLDLDYFKAVNDSLGHAAGDHVLRHVASVLTVEVRAGDTIARVGGDEFVLLLPGMTDSLKLERIANRMIRHLSEPVLFEGQNCQVSASIGITVSNRNGERTPSEMLADADLALYASKRAGRGQATMYQGEKAPRQSSD
jgi:diguanylate cyclase (GGDEF)-like protein